MGTTTPTRVATTTVTATIPLPMLGRTIATRETMPSQRTATEPLQDFLSDAVSIWMIADTMSRFPHSESPVMGVLFSHARF